MAEEQVSMAEPIFGKIALIGIGLIGSSIALAARQRNLASHIAIATRKPETLARARELELGDSYTLDPAEAVTDADAVFLCTPVGAFGKVAEQIAPGLKKGAIVTDVGSVKASVIQQVKPHLPDGVHLIPGHPIAGTENSGPDSGFPTLFENRWCILTPEREVPADASAKLAAFWEACGSSVETMTPEHHDMVLAMTSHIPHLIAYNIVGTADDLESVTHSEVIKFSAGGFRDFTRIAASDPEMWRDVFLHNRDAVLETLGRFSEDLSALQRAIRWGDGETLYKLFSRTREIRRQIIDIGQESSAPNFGRDTALQGKSEKAD
jgi:cyclohexadieny/prephenate dehydrogenase